ncbi:MAG: hypothetical protein U9Q05_06140, partial [Thermodesulfobacteriota bacterium]|nr:hypothetical protein [Thermodesulfobacteriota bacterium]
GFWFGYKARQWFHTGCMRPLTQRRSRAKRQARWSNLLFPRPLVLPGDTFKIWLGSGLSITCCLDDLHAGINPDSSSFCDALAGAYKKGALGANAEVKEINIKEIEFNPNLPFGYKNKVKLDQGLFDSQHLIQWEDTPGIRLPHLVGHHAGTVKGVY